MNGFLRTSVIVGVGLAAAVAQAADGNAVLARHTGDLVVLRDDKLVSFSDRQFFKAPYTILYFGAGWCPDCRKFSPALVAAYDRQPPAKRNFEVLFISQDRSEAEMRKFMHNEKMQWPALAYDKVGGAEDLAKYHPKKYIPWLAVIDHEGTVLLHSENDKDAEDVLKQLESKIGSSKPGSNAPGK